MLTGDYLIFAMFFSRRSFGHLGHGFNKATSATVYVIICPNKIPFLSAQTWNTKKNVAYHDKVSRVPYGSFKVALYFATTLDTALMLLFRKLEPMANFL